MKRRQFLTAAGAGLAAGAIAKPAIAQSTPEVKWMPTVTGYIPVTQSAFRAMQDEGFYAQADKAGREIAMQSLTFTPPTAISGMTAKSSEVSAGALTP